MTLPSTSSLNQSPWANLNLFIGDDFDSVEKDQSSSRSLSESLKSAFAAATGWELGQVGQEIKIVDMSADWPAKKPTAHRGQCDQLAAEISKLVSAERSK
jgi:hypothetical protein